MIALRALMLFASLAALTNARAQDLIPDRALEIELKASDPALEGRGPSRTFDYEVTFDGKLHVWAASNDFDPILRITNADGTLAGEDDNSGGGTTACLELAVSQNALSSIRVASKTPGSSGKLVLHVSEAPETDATRAGVATALEALAEAQRLREEGDLAGARERLGAALDRLLLVEGAQRSATVARTCWRFAERASAFGALEVERAACVAFRRHTERTLPEEHPELQNARQNLAATIKALGDLAGARTLEEKVLAVRSRTLPADHPALLAARHNLANTLAQLGDFQGARALHEQVLAIRSRTLPDDHPDLQTSRQNLANVFARLGDFASERALEEKVLEVHSRTLPEDDLLVQRAKSNLAETLWKLGEFGAARALQERVLEVEARTLPEGDPDLQQARTNLAATLWALGEIGAARELEEKVLDVDSRTLPEGHYQLQEARESLAETIASQVARGERTTDGDGGRARCVQLVEAFSRAQVRAAREAIVASSEREAEERCSSMAWALSVSISYARGYGVFESSRALEADSFVLSETTRGAAIVSAQLARGAKDSPRYAELRDALEEASDELAALARKGTTSVEFDRARTHRESVERELVELARGLSGGKQAATDFDLASFAATLEDGVAAVGFRLFDDARLDVADELDSTGRPAIQKTVARHLCAFVVTNGRAKAETSARLALVDLGPIEPIEAAVRAWRDALGVGSASRGVAVSVRETSEPNVRRCGIALREKLLDPLLAELAEPRCIVVALDDALHLVPLDALPFDERLLVGERWSIETRTTLRELLQMPEPLGSLGELVTLGDIEYGAETAPSVPDGTNVLAMADDEPHATDSEPAGILRGGAWSGGFAALPATGLEVRGIARCFRDQFGADAGLELSEHASATRERLIALAPKSRWLHIATHGWFARESIRSWSDPEPLDKQMAFGSSMSGEEQVQGMSPMLLCGLALAGANLSENELGRVRGLITADELSTLDLSSCELVVLSACDTSVGVRRAGQGVASLQKALQMAGARSVITSLWKVPDEATKELMLDFYRRLWVEKKPKHQALWEAKTKLREAKDESGKPKYTTRDWAAWVLTGAQE